MREKVSVSEWRRCSEDSSCRDAVVVPVVIAVIDFLPMIDETKMFKGRMHRNI